MAADIRKWSSCLLYTSVVRVAGYSAYFTRLPESIQDEVIERTSQDL